MCHRGTPDYSSNSYLGMHLGTQSLEAVLIDAELQVTYKAVVRYDVDLPEFGTTFGSIRGPEPNQFLVSPTMYVKALDILLNCLESQGANFHNVTAIGGSAHHGLVFWSELGFRRLCGLDTTKRLHEQLTDSAFELPLTPFWMDGSSDAQCVAMEEQLEGTVAMRNITGSKCLVCNSGPQIRMIYENFPELYERTERISLMSSFLASILVGNIASIDYADGSGMNLLDINSKSWSPECLAACAPDLARRLMKPIASNRLQGRIADYFVKRWGFPPDCMVVAYTGSSPSMLAGLNLHENCLLISLSTNDLIVMSFKHQPQLEDGFVMCHPTNPNEYMGLFSFRNGSQMRQEVCKEVAQGSWRTFNEMLASTPMGNEGHLVMRFDEMEYIPEAKGCLRWDTQIDELSEEALRGRPQFEHPKFEARGVIEGQIMHHRAVATEAGFKFGPNTTIIVVGRSAKNHSILQIVADVFNAPVYIKDDPEPYLMGSAYRARYAFYEYREKNCNCRKCAIRQGREPKLSYSEFFQRAPNKLKLVAEPTPGCDAVYGPLIERSMKMCRLLAASQSIPESRLKYDS